MDISRCPWCGTTDQLYIDYHDSEWGVPVHDDRRLFEFLVLEGAQAGLSWITILRKRENYRERFYNWDINRIANISDKDLQEILLDPGVVRNRLKIDSVRKNAKVALDLQREFGSLDNYFWGNGWRHLSYQEKSRESSKKDIPQRTISPDILGKREESLSFPIIHHGMTIQDFPTEDSISQAISRDLKKRGMSFIGSTIIYAWMQAVGIVDDHIDTCFRKKR